jgi:hypothetical protein
MDMSHAECSSGRGMLFRATRCRNVADIVEAAILQRMVVEIQWSVREVFEIVSVRQKVAFLIDESSMLSSSLLAIVLFPVRHCRSPLTCL